jgi:hypothetical protein
VSSYCLFLIMVNRPKPKHALDSLSFQIEQVQTVSTVANSTLLKDGLTIYRLVLYLEDHSST